MSGKTALITGASGAIGSAVAARFAQEGANLVLTSRTRGRVCADQVEEFTGMGIRAIHVEVDWSQESEAERAVQIAIGEFGTLDVLVNLAGGTAGDGSLADTGAADWELTFRNNLATAVNSCRAAVPHMTRAPSRIVNTSSIRRLLMGGRGDLIAYGTAKAAINNFTTTVAKEVAPDILVNAVAPGFVYMPAYDSQSQERKDRWLKSTLLRRFLTPDEVSEAYLFLATTTCVAGQVLNVDCGYSLKFE